MCQLSIAPTIISIRHSRTFIEYIEVREHILSDISSNLLLLVIQNVKKIFKNRDFLKSFFTYFTKTFRRIYLGYGFDFWCKTKLKSYIFCFDVSYKRGTKRGTFLILQVSHYQILCIKNEIFDETHTL